MCAQSAVKTLRSVDEFNEGDSTVVFTGDVVSYGEVYFWYTSFISLRYIV